MIPESIQAAFDDCGIEVKQEGWYPLKPPQSPTPYAVITDVESIDYDDMRNVYVSRHSFSVRLYSYLPTTSRDELRNALLAHGVGVTSIACNGPNYDTKTFETVFGIEGEYIEKWS